MWLFMAFYGLRLSGYNLSRSSRAAVIATLLGEVSNNKGLSHY